MAQVAAFGYLGALAQEAEPDQCPIRNLLGCRPPVGSEQPTGATQRDLGLEREWRDRLANTLSENVRKSMVIH